MEWDTIEEMIWGFESSLLQDCVSTCNSSNVNIRGSFCDSLAKKTTSFKASFLWLLRQKPVFPVWC